MISWVYYLFSSKRKEYVSTAVHAYSRDACLLNQQASILPVEGLWSDPDGPRQPGTSSNSSSRSLFCGETLWLKAITCVRAGRRVDETFHYGRKRKEQSIMVDESCPLCLSTTQSSGSSKWHHRQRRRRRRLGSVASAAATIASLAVFTLNSSGGAGGGEAMAAPTLRPAQWTHFVSLYLFDRARCTTRPRPLEQRPLTAGQELLE